jgi:predicted aspartyl protease
MGTFYTGCRVENHTDREKHFRAPKLLVDTGSEYTWLPTSKLEAIGVAREKKDLRFVMANGEVITRSVGFAVLRVDKHFTIDEVVFAEPGDLLLLGARTLEGLNVTVDSRRRQLVAAGPLPAAGNGRTVTHIGLCA